MIRRIAMLCLMLCLAIFLFYASRYWPFRFWGRDALFGLPPQGALVGQWVRGTSLAPFELLIWGLGSILILTGLQKIFER
ncbi:MAG: hypothetical protein AAF264_02755 [Pseudomonadota bacterium]